MADDQATLRRRTALKGAATSGALALGGGALFAFGTGPALAANFNISGPVEVTSDDGSLNYVRVQANHTLEWDGQETDVEYLRYIDRITVRPNSDDVTRTINDTTSDHLSNWSSQGDGSDGWGGPDEFASGPGKAGSAHTGIDWNVIGGQPRSIESPAQLTHLLESDTDGETKESLVVLEKEVRLLDGNENEVNRATASADFVVRVTNEEATTSSTGNGNASGDSTNEEP
jgi:hypothetical protein